MSEYTADSQAIMAEALAAKGITVDGAPSTTPADATQAAVDAMNTANSDRPGARAHSRTEAIMAQALVDAGRLTPEEAAAMARGKDITVDPVQTFEASPKGTAQAVYDFALSDGMDPELSKYYSNKLERALSAPPVSDELRIQSRIDVQRAMAAEFGADADAWGDVARRELGRLAKSYPELPRLLEKTNLGNDIGVIKGLIAHAGNRAMKARGYGG